MAANGVYRSDSFERGDDAFMRQQDQALEGRRSRLPASDNQDHLQQRLGEMSLGDSGRSYNTSEHGYHGTRQPFGEGPTPSTYDRFADEDHRPVHTLGGGPQHTSYESRPRKQDDGAGYTADYGTQSVGQDFGRDYVSYGPESMGQPTAAKSTNKGHRNEYSENRQDYDTSFGLERNQDASRSADQDYRAHLRPEEVPGSQLGSQVQGNSGVASRQSSQDSYHGSRSRAQVHELQQAPNMTLGNRIIPPRALNGSSSGTQWPMGNTADEIRQFHDESRSAILSQQTEYQQRVASPYGGQSHQQPHEHVITGTLTQPSSEIPPRFQKDGHRDYQAQPQDTREFVQMESMYHGGTPDQGEQVPIAPLQYHHQMFDDITQPRRSSDTPRSPNRLRTTRNFSDLPPSPSLGLSPYSAHPRISSPATRTPSPDHRMSFVDLLNVPYPQPAPAASNAQLRSSLGQNMTLLDGRKTLEMYRANVKKTSDAAVQYEFAVLMITSSSAEGASEGDSAEMLKEGRAILQKLADRSYPFAQYYLADGYASGLFNKGVRDDERAFPLFVAASKHGHAEAGYRAALCYEYGWGCRRDLAKAVQFFRQSASKSHPGAMTRLGLACLRGELGLGTPQHGNSPRTAKQTAPRYREGLKWLKRGAESADIQYNSAPYELGLLHETGYGPDVFVDAVYTAQLFTQSADLGHAEAAYRLGDAYEHGKLKCPRDPSLSVHFYTEAAQRGKHPLAMMALCAWFMVGAEPVLAKDESEAYEWARKSADHGYPKAEYAVGYFTEMGIGCRRDPLEANVWYVQAAEHGDDRAQHRISAIRAAASGAGVNVAAAPVAKAMSRKSSFGLEGMSDSTASTERLKRDKEKKKWGLFG